MGGVFGEALMVDESTANRSRFDKGKFLVLVLVPFGRQCEDSVEVVIEKKVFPVSVAISLIKLQWLEKQLGLEMKEVQDNSNFDPVKESLDFQKECRGPEVHVQSPSVKGTCSGKKVKEFQKGESDTHEKKKEKVKECSKNRNEGQGRIVLLAQIQRMDFGIQKEEGISKVIVLRKA
ncbi:hypothetical protein Q3G72_034643 [Acer saccharum]|nr:hypothetical protein Q3G72_034643 [Acer saccharum]